ncbi:hypothetical protein A2U01_0090699, partial [Trifolium medium]|nr:hypothetical protein [Trifolium medium]
MTSSPSIECHLSRSHVMSLEYTFSTETRGTHHESVIVPV